MGQIHINYDEVNRKATEIRRRMSSEIISGVEREHQQIQMMLTRVDGATAAKLKDTMGTNKDKIVSAANNMSKLLSFMLNSSKQVEVNEQRMAKDISSGVRGGRM